MKTWPDPKDAPEMMHSLIPDEWDPLAEPHLTPKVRGRRLPPKTPPSAGANPRRDAGRPPTHPITQRDLAEFAQCKRELDEANKRYEKKRGQLLDATNAGATVEDGAFHLDIKTTESQRMSEKSLLPVLGHEKIQELKRLIKPTLTVVVRVTRVD